MTEEERKQKKKEYMKDYREKNKQKIQEQKKEYMKAYYEIYTTIKLCEACDVELTRTGKLSATDINLDHCHETGRFRMMLCGTCNRHDGWKKYFC